jgi:hypothetical protein
MNKEIKISPELFGGSKPKTQRKSSTRDLKKSILESISSPDLLEGLDTVKPSVSSEPLKPTTYGCLKNGVLPTFRQTKRATTVKQYASFGKCKSHTVRVLIKDRETYAKIEKDIKKIEKRPMSEIREYLRTRKLYKIGSSAPDEVLRTIYKNAILTGNVENNNSDTLVHNYLNDTS